MRSFCFKKRTRATSDKPPSAPIARRLPLGPHMPPHRRVETSLIPSWEQAGRQSGGGRARADQKDRKCRLSKAQPTTEVQEFRNLNSLASGLLPPFRATGPLNPCATSLPTRGCEWG